MASMTGGLESYRTVGVAKLECGEEQERSGPCTIWMKKFVVKSIRVAEASLKGY